MQPKYDAPELTLIGQAQNVVMGIFSGGDDAPYQAAWDFEFAQD
jgi:hypothetical protein